jgi:hypothetical protein
MNRNLKRYVRKSPRLLLNNNMNSYANALQCAIGIHRIYFMAISDLRHPNTMKITVKYIRNRVKSIVENLEYLGT